MSLPMLGWLFALGVAAHNAEEAWLLPSWPGRPRFRWAAVEAGPFRFAAALLSLVALLAAWLAGVGGAHSLGAYFIAGYAAAMVLNVFLPHLAATVALRTYAPGTATALLFNLPLGGWLAYRLLAERWIEPSVFAVSGPLTVLGIAALGASLLWLGQRWAAQRASVPRRAACGRLDRRFHCETAMTIAVRPATFHDLEALVPLFDGYRQFYGKPSDEDGAREFLTARLRLDESRILLARDAHGAALGFTQLYPLFSSVRMVRTWLLNDLFVAAHARRQGVAKALLEAAATQARNAGVASLSLSTAHDNLPAQALYESLGWRCDTQFREYALVL